MQFDDTLRKLALPLAVVAAILASSASTPFNAGHPGLTPRVPTLDAKTVQHWQEAYQASAPLLQLGN